MSFIHKFRPRKYILDSSVFLHSCQTAVSNYISHDHDICTKHNCLFPTRSLQGLYNWAACDVTNPNLSPLLSLTFQVISGTPQIFRLLNPRDKKRYYATQYFNFSVTLLRYGLKILTDSWIEGDSLGYPDHPPRRCHSGRQPTFIHFFTNTLKCLHGRLAG